MSGLEQEFPGRVVARNLDALEPEAKSAVESLGFKNHGLVIRDAAGKVLWKQPDHEVRMEDVHKALGDLLSPSS